MHGCGGIFNKQFKGDDMSEFKKSLLLIFGSSVIALVITFFFHYISTTPLDMFAPSVSASSIPKDFNRCDISKAAVAVLYGDVAGIQCEDSLTLEGSRLVFYNIPGRTGRFEFMVSVFMSSNSKGLVTVLPLFDRQGDMARFGSPNVLLMEIVNGSPKVWMDKHTNDTFRELYKGNSPQLHPGKKSLIL